MKYPNTIKESRYAAKIYTQTELSKIVDCHKVMVSKWEAGKTFPSYPNLVKLSMALKKTIKELYPELPSA
jgi:transcriptional regulator with XRE-family HTH domain